MAISKECCALTASARLQWEALELISTTPWATDEEATLGAALTKARCGGLRAWGQNNNVLRNMTWVRKTMDSMRIHDEGCDYARRTAYSHTITGFGV